MLFLKRPGQTLVVAEASYVRLEAQDWVFINVCSKKHCYRKSALSVLAVKAVLAQA